MNTPFLKELRDLRNRQAQIEARLQVVNPEAAREAVAILAQENRDKGEFTVPDVGTFQLQRTDVFDMTDYNRYKGEECINWRTKKKQQDRAKDYVKALTKEMKGISDGFIANHPDWEPDEIKLIVKVID